jgi:hypothetical protein
MRALNNNAQPFMPFLCLNALIRSEGNPSVGGILGFTDNAQIDLFHGIEDNRNIAIGQHP